MKGPFLFFNTKEFLIFGVKIIEMKTNKKIILNELSNLLKARFEDKLKDVVLFGSRANGTSQ